MVRDLVEFIKDEVIPMVIFFWIAVAITAVFFVAPVAAVVWVILQFFGE